MTLTESPLATLEALIFCGTSGAALRRVLGWNPGQIAAGVHEINTQLEKSGRPYEIVEVGGGFQFRTRPELGEVIAEAQPERKLRLSRAALDTLAVVAYRQPLSRPEIEETRSVDCGAVLKSLLDRGLVRVVGRRDAPGRPALYGTSAAFLETFGLGSLRDLPELRDLMPDAAVEATPIEQAISARRASEADDTAEDDSESGAESEGAASGLEEIDAEPSTSSDEISAEAPAGLADSLAQIPAGPEETAEDRPSPDEVHPEPAVAALKVDPPMPIEEGAEVEDDPRHE